MPIIKNLLSELMLQAARAAQAAGELPEFELPAQAPLNVPKNPELGDQSSALAMQLARPARRKPLDIANTLAAHWPGSDLVAEISVSPPGFVNLKFNPAWFAAQVDHILQAGAAYADLDSGQGLRAQVEYVSANPTGPLNVGRVRGGVIGDTMANLLAAAGYDVSREYYFNNAGQQMINLGESLRVRYLQALGQDAELEDHHYSGDYLIDVATKLVEAQSDSLAAEDWQPFKQIAEQAMFESINTTLARLNIHMDVYFNEQSLYESNAVWQVVDDLRARDLVYEAEGAVWFKTTALGAEEDRVIVKSNGLPTYRLPDIAYHRDKLARGFDLVIDVLGADHKDAFPDVMRGLDALELESNKIRLLMNQFVTFKGSRMSTRAGNVVMLDDVIDEVGADVVRFFLLMRAAESHLDFDLDLAREESDKNPVYYVQYAHARICSILRKAEEEGVSAEGGDVHLLAHPGEQALIRQILDLSETIESAVAMLAPHQLTIYARELASTFHAFYRDCLVIDPGNLPLTAARLKLVTAARIGLARVLALIGVGAPERM